VTEQLRQRIRQRAKECCEYCLYPQGETAISHQIDHVRAKQHGGTDDEENLCLCCAICNRYKGPNLSSIDPETQDIVLLFNPRKQVWPQHFRLDEERIVGLTPEGRATVFLLQFNSEQRLLERRLLVALGYFQKM
jgi:exopolyphosphatase/pppGpp-phosphohydrolase